MRPLTITILFAALAPTACAQDDKPAPPELKTTTAKVSYSIGRNIGEQFASQGMRVDLQLLLRGINASLAGEDELLTQEQVMKAFTDYRTEMVKQNKADADKFLEANQKQDGVKRTKSGLQYLVLKSGSGASPKPNHKVSAHYRGSLLNGHVFDESYEGEVPTEDEQPRSFGVTGVIAGWTEALQLMKVGDKFRLFIPPDLAYGESGRRGIPGNSLLIFDLELVDTGEAISQ